MKSTKCILTLFSFILVTNVFAVTVDKHDFSAETWSKGKSCLICHDLKNNLPKLSPAGARVVDLTKLSAEEQAAFDSNPKNLICYVCHQAQHSTIPPKTNVSTQVTLPGGVKGGISSGSDGSVNIRVTNRGTNGLDCLLCHDLHNKESDKMLKSDY